MQFENKAECQDTLKNTLESSVGFKYYLRRSLQTLIENKQVYTSWNIQLQYQLFWTLLYFVSPLSPLYVGR